MERTNKSEASIILVILIPFLYLASIWSSLPEKVPMHWGMDGEVDRFGDKIELWLIPVLLPLLTYLLFLLIPIIDPKKKIEQMGGKYQSLKFILIIFMSALALFIIHSSKNQDLASPNIVLAGIGVLYIIIGNFMKTIKPNYFLGIRTPWTLENESIWKQTHKSAGILWFAGGLLILVTSLFLSNKSMIIFFVVVTGIISIIPMVHSYLLYKKVKS